MQSGNSFVLTLKTFVYYSQFLKTLASQITLVDPHEQTVPRPLCPAHSAPLTLPRPLCPTHCAPPILPRPLCPAHSAPLFSGRFPSVPVHLDFDHFCVRIILDLLTPLFSIQSVEVSLCYYESQQNVIELYILSGTSTFKMLSRQHRW